MKSILYYLFLTSLIGYLDAVKFRCDYKKSAWGWYKFHEIYLPFSSARMICQYEGAILASPTTAQMRQLMTTFNGTKDIFTGIHSSFAPGFFYSIDGIPLADIPHTWAEYETNENRNKQFCTSINSEGHLSHVDCNEPRPFMCLREYSNLKINECGTVDPDYHLSRETNKCYKFHAKTQNFHNANRICIAEGGHLVVINSQTEANVVKGIYQQYPDSKIITRNGWPGHIFVGFYDWTENADWITIEGQTLKESGFSTFAPGEPNRYAGLKENCGAMNRNGLLNDIECGYYYPFVCEKNPHNPPIC